MTDPGLPAAANAAEDAGERPRLDVPGAVATAGDERAGPFQEAPDREPESDARPGEQGAPWPLRKPDRPGRRPPRRHTAGRARLGGLGGAVGDPDGNRRPTEALALR